MGFKKAPAMPATEVIPVVTETTTDETAANYEQNTANRKGLLSTILSERRRRDSRTEGNTTLG